MKEEFENKYVSDQEFEISLICLENLIKNIEKLMDEIKDVYNL